MSSFTAKILIIGINPYVLLPDTVLASIFTAAGKDKSPIPVKGKIDGHSYQQTLVKYSGKWRLYLNEPMRSACGKEVGDSAKFTIQFDREERITAMHPALEAALKSNQAAHKKFDELPPYLQKEIKRYINGLKTPGSIDKNVARAINFLNGKEAFIGRPLP